MAWEKWDAMLLLGDTNILQYSNKNGLCKLWKTPGPRRQATSFQSEPFRKTANILSIPPLKFLLIKILLAV